ncbi:Uncharacterised protein [Mycoplasmopsis maculosa]|uniref:Lipoprotein n=1 Tax=Mycoplasmopsis maculosa TaxID=114885 RepID=A0A449B4A5_9BACT|nr:hypothetical protein [Mycoplasmopsis maculosa]VEU75427.1 Uncharacterised protein [Mycoplasmopsis maculosa]
MKKNNKKIIFSLISSASVASLAISCSIDDEKPVEKPSFPEKDKKPENPNNEGIELKLSRENEKAFITNGMVTRDFSLTLDYSSKTKPLFFNESSDEKIVDAIIEWNIILKDEKKTKLTVKGESIKAKTSFVESSKELKLFLFSPVPAIGNDENGNPVEIESYSIKNIEIKKDDLVEKINLDKELVSEQSLDYSFPKVKDVIKKDNKFYIEFDKSIEGLSFSSMLIAIENISAKKLPDENYSIKVLNRKNSDIKNILEISLVNIDQNIESVRLGKLYVKNSDRVYIYKFSTLTPGNENKFDDINITLKTKKDSDIENIPIFENPNIDKDITDEPEKPAVYKSVVIPNSRIESEAFITQNKVIREFNFELPKEQKPEFIKNNDASEKIKVKLEFKVGIKGMEEKTTIISKEINSFIKYSTSDKKIIIKTNSPIPTLAIDSEESKEIISYEVSKILILNGDKTEEISLQNVTHDEVKDYKSPIVKDVINQGSKIYVEFDKDISSMKLAGVLVSIKELTPTIMNDSEYTIKVVKRNRSDIKNIVEISLNKELSDLETARIGFLYLKNEDRIYSYQFNTFLGSNNNKWKDVFFDTKEAKQGVDLKEERQPEEAFVANTSVLRDFNYEKVLEEKPTYLENANTPTNKFIELNWKVKVKGSNEEILTTSDKIDSEFKYDSETKKLIVKFISPIPVEASRGSEKLEIVEYKLESIKIFNSKTESSSSNIITFETPFVSNKNLDYSLPKFLDVINHEKAFYASFDKDLSDFTFASRLNKNPILGPLGFMPLEDDQYEIKKVNRKGTIIKNIIKLSPSENISDDVKSIGLITIYIKNADRIYQYFIDTRNANNGSKIQELVIQLEK